MTAPDPGLTDLVAAEVAKHAHDFGAMWHDDHRACICGHVLREADKQAEHVAEHVALVVEQHTNGRIAELEAELERYHAEERADLEWERFCAQQDVRCTECGLRYGERKDYTCPHIGEHKYDADELRAALEGEQQ